VAPGHGQARLREAGARESAAALTARRPMADMFRLFLKQEGRADQFRSGRQASGSPGTSWGRVRAGHWLPVSPPLIEHVVQRTTSFAACSVPTHAEDG
jgi:hypothetical protein